MLTVLYDDHYKSFGLCTVEIMKNLFGMLRMSHECVALGKNTRWTDSNLKILETAVNWQLENIAITMLYVSIS